MPKLKTNKSAAKRIRITKNGKAVKITAGQGHFNSRESGKTKMNKRRDVSLSKSATKVIKKQLPHK